MKYKEDDYEYERRRREVEQRKRVRPDSQMTSQRRRNTADSQDSYAKRCAQSYEGSRRAGTQSYYSSGSRSTSSRSASQGSAARRTASQSRTRQQAARRPAGADPYDRRYSSQAGRDSRYYEDMSSRKRQRPAEEPAGKNGKKQLSAKAKKKRRTRRILFTIEGILLVLVFACLFVISKWDLIKKASFGKKDVHVNELSANTVQSMEGYKTIAVFGIDEEGSHSDVIMIANINNETKEIILTSVLRDTYWNVPDLSTGDTEKYAKANNAYHTGGSLGALNALNKNLDLSITEYVTVNWYAVAQVVDQLGGLEIDVPETMMGEINGYITNTQEETHSWATGAIKGTTQIKGPGLQTLDGIQTVAYCRIRHNNGGDDGRAQRQREVVGMILDKAKQKDLGTLLDICNIVFPEVETNMSLADILAMAPDIGKYKIVNNIAFPYHQIDTYINGSVKVPLGLAEDVAQLHADLFGDTSYAPSATVQQISNKIEDLSGYSAEDRMD